MKIAIQGHPTRGKEVIQILESLGGKNNANIKGTFKKYYYFIDLNGTIDYTEYASKNIHTYTLEKFKKEFPFKVGDIVLLKGINNPFEIIALEWFMNKLCYKLDNGLHYASNTLTTYKEMKEERNITLTLDKAKEWYNKGGELREIALQAFTEKELNPLPKSWEEFCKQGNPIASWRYSIPTKYEALYQLEQLRDCYRNSIKMHCLIWYKIYRSNNKYTICPDSMGSFLSFPTESLARQFLNNFKDLIIKVGDLI